MECLHTLNYIYIYIYKAFKQYVYIQNEVFSDILSRPKNK